MKIEGLEQIRIVQNQITLDQIIRKIRNVTIIHLETKKERKK